MENKSIKYNFFMNFILTVSSILFPLITFPYVSRVLLVEGNGIVAFSASITTYFSMFASLGIPTYGIRACAKVRDDKSKLSTVVQELFIINIITTFIVSIAFVLSIYLVPKFNLQKELFLINGITLILNALGVNWLYSALEQYKYITIRSLIFKIISILLMFLFVKNTNDYVIYGAILVFASAGSNILNFINLRKFVSFKKTEKYDFSQHIKPILIFFGTSAAISVYTNLDVAMLGFIKSDIEVGYYNVGIKVKTVFISLVTSLGTVLLPRLSYYIENNKIQEFKKMIVKAINFVLVVSTPIVLYFVVYAKQSVLLLSGPAYMGSIIPVQFLMPTVLLIGLSNITGIQVLVPLNKEKELLISIIFGAVIDFVLNLYFINLWGASGAAASTLIAELVVLLVQCIYLRKYLHQVLGQISFIKIAFANIISLAVISPFRYAVTFSKGIFIELLLTATIFFLSYGIVLVLTKETFVIENILPFIKKRKDKLFK